MTLRGKVIADRGEGISRSEPPWGFRVVSVSPFPRAASFSETRAQSDRLAAGRVSPADLTAFAVP